MSKHLKKPENLTYFQRLKHWILLHWHRIKRVFCIFSIGEWIFIAGVTASFALMLVLFYTFFVAFASPSKAVIVYINDSGEANFEAVLVFVSFVLGGSAFITILNDIRARAIWRRALFAEKIRRI